RNYGEDSRTEELSPYHPLKTIVGLTWRIVRIDRRAPNRQLPTAIKTRPAYTKGVVSRGMFVGALTQAARPNTAEPSRTSPAARTRAWTSTQASNCTRPKPTAARAA